MRKLSSLVILSLGLSFALTACSGGNAVSAPPSPAPSPMAQASPLPTAAATSGPAVALSAELSDTALTPNTFTVPVGANVTFTVKSTRTDERDCVFMDIATMKLYPGQAQWSLVQIAAGTTKSLAFVAPSQPASYQIECGGAGFSGRPTQPVAGLTGTLTVK